MAEVVLTVASRMMISEAKNAVFELVKLGWTFDNKLNELQRFLDMIEAFLDDAETKSTDSPVKVWLKWLADGASRAQDVLAELAYEAKRIELQVNNRWGRKLIDSFSPHNPTIFRLRMAYKVKSVTKSLDKICSKGTRLGLQNRVQHVAASSSGLEETHAFLGDPEHVVRRKDDVSKVVNMLISSSNTSHPLGVVSIVGMAGLGKTTLAKMVLKDTQVTNLFDKRQQLWVCVSNTFDVKMILSKMLECLTSATIASFESLSKQSLVIRLQEELKEKPEFKEKSFLLVLDDVWNKDDSKWKDLMACLVEINQNNRSTILATTRDMEVASTMGSFSEFTYELPILKDHQCWCIIRAQSFRKSSEIPRNLEIIGRSIAEKCKGVALVASVIGGTLSKRKTEEAWSSIQNSKSWNSLESNKNILPILRLSYDRLDSTYLKLCFAYCSSFPEDSLLYRQELIHLWMAAGFLHPSPAHFCDTAWDTGVKYFNDLISNSLFQDVERDLYGNITTCKMHDLIHSLARSLLGAAILASDTNSSTDVSFIRHLNIIGEESNLARGLKQVDASKLRSLFSNFDIFCHMPKKCKRLRTLKLRKATGADKIPKSIGKLKHLRYFDISGTQIESLPRSFTELLSLQTLKVTECENLKELPKQMENLVELSHLYIDKESLMPINIGRLTKLQTLPLFFVGAEGGRGIEQLGNLRHLQGKLVIRRLELVTQKDDAGKAKLQEKEAIYELVLEWGWSRGVDVGQHEEGLEGLQPVDVGQHEEVLEGLQPHSNLKGLQIRNYKGVKFPSWLPITSISNSQPSLPNLTMLKLDFCYNCVKLPSLGHLHKLTYLFIKGLSGVKMIDADFYGNGNFPALKEFELRDMESLEEWSEATRRDLFPSLEKLSLRDCRSLRSIQLTDGLPRLKMLQCDCLSVSDLGDGLFSSNYLRKLEISNCVELEFLPSFRELCSLTHLELVNCKNLRCAPDGLQHCTSLQRLKLDCCPEMSSELEWLGSLKNLNELEIFGCFNIVWGRIPETSLGCLTHLKRLFLYFNFSKEVRELPPCFTSIHHLHGSLIQLELSEGHNIESLPHQMQHLTALQELELHRFNGLETLPQWLGNLSSLKELRIWGCKKLRSLSPLKAMPSLTHLTLNGMGEFGGEIPQYFDSIDQSIPSSLEILRLARYGCRTLPPQIQHLTTLKVLKISDFPAIEDLPEWLGNLSSLQQLDIFDCRSLGKLPSQQSMLRLSNLKSIDIWDCPKVSEIYFEGSPQWSDISHIPKIHILKL